LPPLLFLLSLAAMIAAIARPVAVITLPSDHRMVLLAMDVSLSMRAVDVQPSRIVAAQNAARAFVAEQPRGTKIGVVAFAGTATLVQAPTHNKEDILGAIDRFKLQRATAVGSGILVSLAAIFPDAEFDLRSTNPRLRDGKDSIGKRGSLDSQRGLDKGGDLKSSAKTAAPGSYSSAVIILLTDGQTTTGPDPIESAKMAAERGVRVFTVGVGTENGEIMGNEGWRMRVRLDEDSLKKIANITQGEYFYAGNAADLKKVYESLNSKLVLEKKETEITAVFSALAAVLAILAAMLSLFWFNRIV
jgi:Ca-activated chloride channel family protein